jgi:sec-independent protein translocase protein TatC
MPEAELVGLGPAEAFIVKLKVALVSGIVLASPVIFFQVWTFISPGLHENEQKLALPFVAISTFSFLTGILFCFFVILPFAFSFFLGEFQSINVEPTIRIGEYLGFVLKLLLVFGSVFNLPVVSWFLAKLGILTPEWLVKNGRYAILGIFIVAAILTPPDIATQLLLAGPLIVLYGICIQVTKIANKPSSRD